MTITKETIIGDILDAAPETAPLFLEIGMHCLGCPSSRGETIAQACYCLLYTSRTLRSGIPISAKRRSWWTILPSRAV